MGRTGIPVLLVIWLIVGAVIAGQRGYFSGEEEENCASIGSAVITIAIGPLNLLGLNPEIECPELPEVEEPTG
ncbi:hypothetical protein [Allosalinactinospora lopnorensis]|uniref:hypothetical protein n=1 Tax=Allosalinactinospora lopnorensis TaxID=1352348 RepID=UPI000623D6D5|nr:hypothetical protein [Allosalinactinospora lopnorensis]